MIHQPNDKSINHQEAAGSETVFKELFLNWYPFLAAHIFRITRSQPLTEEIVQDVFLKIWLTRETLKEIENFKAYLLVVSRNHALNALRKVAADARKQEAYLKERESETEREVEEQSTVFYSLIDEAIDALSERQREIYLMHRHQRMTYQEIADKLNLSRETIKTHLQNAIASITKFIKLRV